MLAHDLEHAVRRRPVTPQYRCGADRKRKGHSVAEPIGEKQLRRRMHDVVFVDAEHALAEGPSIEGKAAIQITNPELNPRFTVGLIQGVEPRPSPYRVQMRLRLAGMLQQFAKAGFGLNLFHVE